ncbi:MAG: hypothetical protein IJ679_09650 [Lachnospiraceae bacterium]|nr:hypothetical protein [Lachnospiraceae bacterium]
MKNKKKAGAALLLAFALLLGLAAPSAQVEAKGKSIKNVGDFYAIQADVTVSGSGTGYHAKLGYVTPLSAISFGIQHDEFASPPYTGTDALMVENVYSNDPGMQRYDWLGITLNPGQTYRLMLTLSKSGNATVYLDGKALRTYQNPGLQTSNSNDEQEYLANPQPRVEGAGRKNGDVVDAHFANIQLKEGNYRDFKKYKPTNANALEAYPGKKYDYFLPTVVKANPTLKVASPSKNSVRVSGSISGLPDNMDWDSAYESVSGIKQWTRNATYFPPKGHPDHT